MTGEVANRFPGQHRGRLGWSSGQRGARSYPANPHPISLDLCPAQSSMAPFGPVDVDLPAPLWLTSGSLGSPGSCHILLPSDAQGSAREVQAGHPGVSGSLQPPPAPSHLGDPFAVQKLGLEAEAREGPTLPSGSLCPSVRFFSFLGLSSTNFLANKYLFVISKTNKKKKTKTVKQVKVGEQKENPTERFKVL